jgi:hypothetical protein
MSVKERLISFVKSNKMSIRKFELTCGLSLGYINNIRVSIQPDKISRIASHFPELNTGWLLTGEGEMLRKDDTILTPTPPENDFIKFLQEENKKCHKIIEDQMEIMKGLQKTIEILQNQINEKSKASAVPEAGAGCAAVG